MDENTSTGASATQTPVAPTTGTPAQTSVTPQSSPLSLEEAMKRIADLEHSLTNAKEENSRHSKKLSTFEKMEAEREAAKKAADAAQLSETERLKQELADERTARADIAAALFEADVYKDIVRLAPQFHFIIDAETLFDMIKWKEIEADEETGKPTNVEKLLERLAKASPKLVEAAQPPAPTPPPTPAQPGIPGWQRPPAVPAMNPGRSSIAPPSSLPAGKIPSLAEAYAANKTRQP